MIKTTVVVACIDKRGRGRKVLSHALMKGEKRRENLDE